MSINERVKAVRNALNLTQKDFGQKLICLTFNVSEEWLQTGTGEMFLESDSTIVSQLSSEYGLDASGLAEAAERFNSTFPAAENKDFLEWYVVEQTVSYVLTPQRMQEIAAWLKLFCKGDLFDMEFRRRIIDTFINSVYLYDDRVIVFYNIRGGKQVSYIDMLDATEGFPGLDDEPAPADSAETPDAKKKPDTVSGVRLLNGVVEISGIEPLTS